MLNCCKKKKETLKASARVVDGKLILSLPEAENPIIWQMDLTQTKASALEIQHNMEENTHILVLKTPRGETVNIAPFINRSLALEGLMAASYALENAGGHIRQSAAANDPSYAVQKKPCRWGRKLLMAVLCLLGIFVLFNLWASQQTRSPSSRANNLVSSSENARQSSGVPVSADDFLRAQ